MPTSTGLDEKLSDVIGYSKLTLNKNLNFDYNFAIDQNYNEFNYNELNANLNFNMMKLSTGYLKEQKHIGDQEYLNLKIDLEKGKNAILSAETKKEI